MAVSLAPLLLAAASLHPTAASPTQGAQGLPLLDHAKLRLAMTRLASEHADLVSLHSLGFSRGAPNGEPLRIEALRLAAGKLGDGRPGILLVANLEGPAVYTSGLALEVARRLAEDYAVGDIAARDLLDRATLYVVPRANPDGAEARFAAPLAERLGTGHGADDDRDGLQGEDAPSDVDGDGLVSWMRVPDPAGAWRADEHDPRILVRADAAQGERGAWKLVPEGRDADGDGEAAEDPPRDARVDRNFPAGFEDLAARAGLFPTDEPEARALVDFVLARPDIQLVVVYGANDNLITPPSAVDDDAPDVQRVPPAAWRRSDADRLADLARAYREIATVEAKGEGDDAGTFARWCYEHRGLMTLAIRPWAVPLEADPAPAPGAAEAEKPAADAQPAEEVRRLRWLEVNGVPDAHLGWRAFRHPELGEVEVGGWRPYAALEPPPPRAAELVGEQCRFLTTLSGRLARLALADVHAVVLGSGLVEVHATVVDEGYLPLVSTWGKRTRTTRPARVVLRLPEGAELVAGQRLELVDDLAGSGGRAELTWLVRNAPPEAIGVSVESDHAGRAQAQPEVRR